MRRKMRMRVNFFRRLVEDTENMYLDRKVRRAEACKLLIIIIAVIFA
jgi:hypothetical protein